MKKETIKLSKIIKEIKGFVELDLSEFEDVLETAFKRKYPDSNLYFLESDLKYISTDEEEPDAASMWGSGKKEEYYLALNAYIDEGELIILVENASAGNYKGVTGDLLKAIFDKAKQKYSPITRSVLAIRDDRSGGKWEQIASKLGVEYEDADE